MLSDQSKASDPFAADSSVAPDEWTITVSERPDEHELRDWDALVAAIPGSDVTQLSGWAEVRRSVGYRPLYVFARGQGRLLGGVQVLVRRLPVVGPVGYVSYGPLIASGAPREQVVEALTDALDAVARRRLRALFVQPLDLDDISHALLARGFRTSTAGVAPGNTVRIALSAEEEQLRAGLSKRIRRWTGKWEKSGVGVRRGGPEDVNLLIELVRRSAEHQGYTGLTPEYIRNLYQRLNDAGHAELFVGEVDGEPVAAELFTACGGVLRSRLTGLDRHSPATRLSVTSAVDWAAILWARRNGFHEFDLGGLSVSAASAIVAGGFSTPELSGPERFKVGFGGRLHTYPPAVELISSRLLRFAYDRVASAAGGRAAVDAFRSWMREGPRNRRALTGGTSGSRS